MLFLYELAGHVQEMPSSIALRESLWIYPIIETVHVLGLCLFVGTAWLWDLRLLGVTLRRVPVSAALDADPSVDRRRALPSWPSAASGSCFRNRCGSTPNIFFRIKLVLLIAAGLNAFIFHRTVGRRKEEWDWIPLTPFRARLAGALSLGLWAAVIVTGRLIAYNWFGRPDPEP